MSTIKKTTVLIVDDSALIRNLLSEIISSSQFLEVIGTCADPYEAREKIKQLSPESPNYVLLLKRMFTPWWISQPLKKLH